MDSGHKTPGLVGASRAGSPGLVGASRDKALPSGQGEKWGRVLMRRWLTEGQMVKVPPSPGCPWKP